MLCYLLFGEGGAVGEGDEDPLGGTLLCRTGTNTALTMFGEFFPTSSVAFGDWAPDV